uniref:UDP-glucuronosyltransferase n=1 Tax=Helicoverpa armigera TaxID=29058 RepID=G9LPN7_HELAM|nr:UDP-glycosyltransferase UGT33B7 [Helicoverpa armigera]
MISVALFIFTLSVTNNHAAKILAVFPVPSISHQVVFRPLTQELARRGHEVTVITPDPVFPKGEAPANLTEIDVHFTYEEWEKLYKITSAADSDLIKQMRGAFSMIVDVFEIQMKVDEVQKLLKEKFDLILVEACARPAIVLSHVFKAPLIQVSSFGPMNFNVETVGSAWHPLLYPVNLSKRVYNLTMWEKVLELWNFYKLENVMREVEYEENKMTRRLFGPNVPTINELQNNVDMLFLNVHPVWEGNRPVPPSVIYMGGMHQKPVKELPEDLKTYLDSSKNGVIYISFGTNVKPSLLPPDRMKILLNVLSQQPYDVLWKWDKDELPGRTSNIRISKWLPQSDLLRHPKIKVFITQGGLQSTDEAITAGVPLIGVPILGDQWYNVEKYEHHKIGVRLDLETLTEEQFEKAINDVIGDKRYRENIIKLGQVMFDQPQPPLERAVWWTEHVLRHGGARHLRSPAANMSWTQFLELELVLTVVAVLLPIVFLLSVLVYKIFKYVIVSPKEKIKSN